MSNHARANRISQTNTAASAILPFVAVDTNIERVYIEPEDPPSDIEILDEMKKQACMGTAAVKKAFLLRYREEYIAFAARMKPHDPDLAERFEDQIPTVKQLQSANLLSLPMLADKILEMWKCLNHYKESHLQKRASRDVEAAWTDVYTDSIDKFVEIAKINAISMLSKMTVKIDTQEKGR
jgi:hypothetical protein